MSAVKSLFNVDDLVNEYLDGDSVEDVATRWHTSAKPLSDLLKAKGLFRSKAERDVVKGAKISSHSPNKIIFSEGDSAAILAMFASGQTENQISIQFNVSRNVIRKFLTGKGIQPRTFSQSNSLRYIDMSQAEKNAVIKNAQEATRGVLQTIEHLFNRAKGNEKTLPNVSPSEEILSELLAERGIITIPQKAINKYNVDLAAFPVAIEVFGGAWHATKPNHIERMRQIFSEGWDVVIVWSLKNRSPITPACADYIVTFIQERRRYPSSVREYRVIRGDGQFLAAGRANDENIIIVPKGFNGGRTIRKD